MWDVLFGGAGEGEMRAYIILLLYYGKKYYGVIVLTYFKVLLGDVQ